MRMYTAVIQEVKSVGVITSIWFNMLPDPICVLRWPDARMHVTLHYRNVKADVFDNHSVSWVTRNDNKNVHLLITLSVFFRIKLVKKENNSDFKRQLSLTFSKNTLGRRITNKIQLKTDFRSVYSYSEYSVYRIERQTNDKIILCCDAVYYSVDY